MGVKKFCEDDRDFADPLHLHISFPDDPGGGWPWTSTSNGVSIAWTVNVAISEADGKVVFLHKIIPGGAVRSYGIHVAQMAGIPKSVITGE